MKMGAAVVTIAALVFCTAAALSAHKTVVSTFTYYQDIYPIFGRSCASCHDQKHLPPALLRYDDAVGASTAIERALLKQARPEHGAQLTHLEFDRIMTWSAGGTPEGGRPSGAPVPAPRPHAVHAGQLGGMMVPMAGDTLHGEAVFAEQRRLRLFVTTTSGDLVSVDRLRQLRIAVRTSDGSETPFTVAAGGDALEARIPTVKLPAAFVLIDRHDSGTPPMLQFANYSVDPPEFSVPPTVIPSTDTALITAIDTHAAVALKQVAAFQYGQLYVPTTHVRDLLIAMQPGNPDRDRALRAMTRANWALHLAGDNGLPREIREAATSFEAALGALKAAYAK